MEKHSESRLSYLFAHLHLLSSDLFSSDSSHLCFSTVHIVGSIASKLPSIIVLPTLLERQDDKTRTCISSSTTFSTMVGTSLSKESKRYDSAKSRPVRTKAVSVSAQVHWHWLGKSGKKTLVFPMKYHEIGLPCMFRSNIGVSCHFIPKNQSNDMCGRYTHTYNDPCLKKLFQGIN